MPEINTIHEKASSFTAILLMAIAGISSEAAAATTLFNAGAITITPTTTGYVSGGTYLTAVTGSSGASTGTASNGAVAVASGNILQLGSGSSDKLTIVPTATGYIPTGTSLVVIDGASSGAIKDNASNVITSSNGADSSIAVTNQSPWINWNTVYDTQKYDLTLVANLKTSGEIAAAVGTDHNGGAALGALYSMLSSDTTNSTTLASATTGQLALLSSELKTNNGTVTGVPTAATKAFSSVVVGRQMTLLRTSGRYDGFNRTAQSLLSTGISSGDAPASSAIWVEAFGSDIDQNKRGNDEGYKAIVKGIAFGGDALFGKKLRLGLSLGYSNTDVEGDGAGNKQGDQDSFQFGLYGTRYLEDFHVDGLLSVSLNNNKISRTVTLFSDTAVAEYNSVAYLLKLGVGKPMTVGKTQWIPQAHVLWSRVGADAYTETGSVSNMTVAWDAQDSVELEGGISASWEQTAKGITLVPELRGAVSWDVLNAASATTSAGTSGTITSYLTQGSKPPALGMTLGGGLGIQSEDKMLSLTLNYDASVKSDYVAHSGSLKLRYDF